jgi:MoxR-like ATPase
VAGVSGGEGEGVLITGVYGAGKSSVAEEVADALEARGARFGAVDLDWLMWFGVPGVEPENLRRVFLANLAAVVANYRDAGLFTSFLLGRCAIGKR